MSSDLKSPEAREFFGSAYHIWWYESNVWLKAEWGGVLTMKSPFDMWNYQEIISELKPSLVVEFGTLKGGSAVFFADLLQQLGHKSKVLTVDPFNWGMSDQLNSHPLIEQLHTFSVTPEVKARIQELRKEYPGPMFVIMDGDHTAENVLKELVMLRDVTVAGDYVINEDANLNGHPVRNEMFPGPYEALETYELHYPDDYEHDHKREHKFGWTCATNGFLKRK